MRVRRISFEKYFAGGTTFCAGSPTGFVDAQDPRATERRTSRSVLRVVLKVSCSSDRFLK
jgi:hypothetical protein